MAKKIRLIDDETVEVSKEELSTEETTVTGPAGSFGTEEVQQLMKYAEAIDWKLWEILKILRAETEEKGPNAD
jgi:hypothetical protein